MVGRPTVRGCARSREDETTVRRLRMLAVVVGLALVVSGVSLVGGQGRLGAGEAVPKCSSLFKDGAKTRKVEARARRQPCRDSEGDEVLVVSAVVKCAGAELDRLVYNDHGWGFVPGRWHAGEPMPPARAFIRCGGG